MTTLSDTLRLAPGPVDLAALDPRSTAGFPGKGKADAPAAMQELAPELSDLQERLWAAGRENPDAPRVLLLLQGLDTSGKGGVIRHAAGLVDPQGLRITSFKAPTAEERRHSFLWRIKRALPGPGMIGVFDRSHYEDVLVARVDRLVPAAEWRKRFDMINRFEAQLARQGTVVVKCFLNISWAEQGERLAERLDNPDKHWKYNVGDLRTRARWDSYMTAYAEALRRCNTEAAPWYVVPSDRKWFRNWAVAQLLLEHLRALDLQWPAADFDVDEQRRKLAAMAEPASVRR